MITSWFSFGIALLKLASAIMTWLDRRSLIDEGRRQVILENALALAARMATKQKLREQIDGLSDDDVDAELRSLEPK